jgi:hypothetical protein
MQAKLEKVPPEHAGTIAMKGHESGRVNRRVAHGLVGKTVSVIAACSAMLRRFDFSGLRRWNKENMSATLQNSAATRKRVKAFHGDHTLGSG